VFISCGEDRDPYRNIGVRAIDNLNQFTAFEDDIGPILLGWDYRRDLPRDLPAGEFERRSLEIVDEAHLLIGVLGPTVPKVTRKEILRAYERQARGEAMSPYVLADPRVWGEPHRALQRKVKRDYKREIVFGHYKSKEAFLHQMYLTLFRFMQAQATPAPPSLSVPGAPSALWVPGALA